MYDVSLLVDHDVAIVPVLDLKQVAHQGVGSHTLDEVSTSLQSTDIISITKENAWER